MVKVELKEAVKMEDLAEGKSFDEDELIIYINKDKTSMDTVRRIPESDEIGIFMYDINHNGRITDNINNNGYRYLKPEEKEDLRAWKRYNDLLRMFRK